MTAVGVFGNGRKRGPESFRFNQEYGQPPGFERKILILLKGIERPAQHPELCGLPCYKRRACRGRRKSLGFKKMR